MNKNLTLSHEKTQLFKFVSCFSVQNMRKTSHHFYKYDTTDYDRTSIFTLAITNVISSKSNQSKFQTEKSWKSRSFSAKGMEPVTSKLKPVQFYIFACCKTICQNVDIYTTSNN